MAYRYCDACGDEFDQEELTDLDGEWLCPICYDVTVEYEDEELGSSWDDKESDDRTGDSQDW